VPLSAIPSIPVEPLAGKVVIDTNNYYWERDGHIAELDDKQLTVSQLLQRRLSKSKVAKGFNHIGSASITTDGTPAGTPNRRALATSSDFPDAAETVTRLYDELGFDTINLGPLSESWRVERDTPAYVTRQNAEELTANLALATRHPDPDSGHHAG
jgi:predicted dinucleotide-binding enzyme